MRTPVERFPVRVQAQAAEPAPAGQLWAVLLMALLGIAIGCYLNGLI